MCHSCWILPLHRKEVGHEKFSHFVYLVSGWDGVWEKGASNQCLEQMFLTDVDPD